MLTTIDLTAHAIQRFRDRVRPALDLDAAAEELARLAGQAELTPCRPPWLQGFAHLYLVLGDVALLRLVRQWLELHRRELELNWARARNKQRLQEIEPLP
jgi:hypothetical protein